MRTFSFVRDGQTVSPESLGFKIQRELATYFCTHGSEPCSPCIFRATDAAKLIAKAIIAAAFTGRRNVEVSYQAAGAAIDVFLQGG